MGRTNGLKNAADDKWLRGARRAELPLDTVVLAHHLIGKILVRKTPEGTLSGRIVETEAYPLGDAAGHAYRGETLRNHALFLRRGSAYVNLAYGRSYLFNVSSETCGIGAGVLVRALEPLGGVPLMQRNRRVQNLRDLTRGPGRLTTALISIAAWTASIPAGRGPCGSRVTTTTRRKSAQARGSGSRAKPTAPFVSTSAVIAS
jgi:DNA-3-methyladenine glycosylase